MSTNGAGGAGPLSPACATGHAPALRRPADRRPVVVEPPRPGGSLCGARPRNELLPHADRRSPRATSFTWSIRSRKSVQLGQGLEASGRLGRSSMGRARLARAEDLPEETGRNIAVERMRLVATEALPPRHERRASSSPAGETRHRSRAPRSSSPRRKQGSPSFPARPLVSTRTEQLLVVGYRRRLDGTRLDRPQPRAAARPAEGHHAPAPRLRSPGLRPFRRAKVVDWISDPAGVWPRSRTCISRRGRRWRAFRADELVISRSSWPVSRPMTTPPTRRGRGFPDHRHVRHGDNRRGEPSGPAPLRPQQGRRAADDLRPDRRGDLAIPRAWPRGPTPRPRASGATGRR